MSSPRLSPIEHANATFEWHVDRCLHCHLAIGSGLPERDPGGLLDLQDGLCQDGKLFYAAFEAAEAALNRA